MINAVISALVMPLGYLACRRLGLDRPAAYGVAMIAALVPAGFFYSQYAMTDAIFPVITLAWLLAVHSWLTAAAGAGRRARYAAAVGSALLAGYAYAVHSRGLVMLVCYAAVGALIAWRHRAARGSVAAAALTALLAVGAAWALNRYLTSALYPSGTRSLSGQLRSTLGSFYGVIHVVEMAVGQVWRLTLDSWGLAGIGLFAALAAIGRRGLRPDLRIMAGALGGGHRPHRRDRARRASLRHVPDLGLRTLPRRHDRHVLPRRRGGAAAGQHRADPRRMRPAPPG